MQDIAITIAPEDSRTKVNEATTFGIDENGRRMNEVTIIPNGKKVDDLVDSIKDLDHTITPEQLELISNASKEIYKKVEKKYKLSTKNKAEFESEVDENTTANPEASRRNLNKQEETVLSGDISIQNETINKVDDMIRRIIEEEPTFPTSIEKKVKKKLDEVETILDSSDEYATLPVAVRIDDYVLSKHTTQHPSYIVKSKDNTNIPVIGRIGDEPIGTETPLTTAIAKDTENFEKRRDDESTTIETIVDDLVPRMLDSKSVPTRRIVTTEDMKRNMAGRIFDGENQETTITPSTRFNEESNTKILDTIYRRMNAETTAENSESTTVRVVINDKIGKILFSTDSNKLDERTENWRKPDEINEDIEKRISNIEKILHGSESTQASTEIDMTQTDLVTDLFSPKDLFEDIVSEEIDARMLTDTQTAPQRRWGNKKGTTFEDKPQRRWGNPDATTLQQKHGEETTFIAQRMLSDKIISEEVSARFLSDGTKSSAEVEYPQRRTGTTQVIKDFSEKITGIIEVSTSTIRQEDISSETTLSVDKMEPRIIKVETTTDDTLTTIGYNEGNRRMLDQSETTLIPDKTTLLDKTIPVISDSRRILKENNDSARRIDNDVSTTPHGMWPTLFEGNQTVATNTIPEATTPKMEERNTEDTSMEILLPSPKNLASFRSSASRRLYQDVSDENTSPNANFLPEETQRTLRALFKNEEEFSTLENLVKSFMKQDDARRFENEEIIGSTEQRLLEEDISDISVRFLGDSSTTDPSTKESNNLEGQERRTGKETMTEIPVAKEGGKNLEEQQKETIQDKRRNGFKVIEASTELQGVQEGRRNIGEQHTDLPPSQGGIMITTVLYEERKNEHQEETTYSALKGSTDVMVERKMESIKKQDSGERRDMHTYTTERSPKNGEETTSKVRQDSLTNLETVTDNSRRSQHDDENFMLPMEIPLDDFDKTSPSKDLFKHQKDDEILSLTTPPSKKLEKLRQSKPSNKESIFDGLQESEIKELSTLFSNLKKTVEQKTPPIPPVNKKESIPYDPTTAKPAFSITDFFKRVYNNVVDYFSGSSRTSLLEDQVSRTEEATAEEEISAEEPDEKMSINNLSVLNLINEILTKLQTAVKIIKNNERDVHKEIENTKNRKLVKKISKMLDSMVDIFGKEKEKPYGRDSFDVKRQISSKLTNLQKDPLFLDGLDYNFSLDKIKSPLLPGDTELLLGGKDPLLSLNSNPSHYSSALLSKKPSFLSSADIDSILGYRIMPVRRAILKKPPPGALFVPGPYRRNVYNRFLPYENNNRPLSRRNLQRRSSASTYRRGPKKKTVHSMHIQITP